MRNLTVGDERIFAREVQRYSIPGYDSADLLQEMRLAVSVAGFTEQSFVRMAARYRMRDLHKRSFCLRRRPHEVATGRILRDNLYEQGDSQDIWASEEASQEEGAIARDLLECLRAVEPDVYRVLVSTFIEMGTLAVQDAPGVDQARERARVLLSEVISYGKRATMQANAEATHAPVPPCHAQGSSPEGYSVDEEMCLICSDKFTCVPGSIKQGLNPKLTKIADADQEVQAYCAGRLTLEDGYERLITRERLLAARMPVPDELSPFLAIGVAAPEPKAVAPEPASVAEPAQVTRKLKRPKPNGAAAHEPVAASAEAKPEVSSATTGIRKKLVKPAPVVVEPVVVEPVAVAPVVPEPASKPKKGARQVKAAEPAPEPVAPVQAVVEGKPKGKGKGKVVVAPPGKRKKSGPAAEVRALAKVAKLEKVIRKKAAEQVPMKAQLDKQKRKLKLGKPSFKVPTTNKPRALVSAPGQFGASPREIDAALMTTMLHGGEGSHVGVRIGSWFPLEVGHRLVRKTKHGEIEIVFRETGFEWGGKIYPSLSAAAQAAHDGRRCVSGNEFFNMQRYKRLVDVRNQRGEVLFNAARDLQ